MDQRLKPGGIQVLTQSREWVIIVFSPCPLPVVFTAVAMRALTLLNLIGSSYLSQSLLYQLREFVQLDAVQIGNGPVVHA